MSIHWDGLWHLGLQRIQSRGSLRVRLAGQKRGANKASLKSPQFPRECLQKTTPSHASPKVCFGASRGNSEAQSERGWEERESLCESGGRKAGEWAGKGGRNGKLAEAPGRGPEFGASAAVDVDVAAAAFGCSVGCGELRVTTATGASWVGFGGGCCVGRPKLLTAAADSASAAASSAASCSSTLMKEICLPAIDLTSRAVQALRHAAKNTSNLRQNGYIHALKTRTRRRAQTIPHNSPARPNARGDLQKNRSGGPI